MQNVYKSIDFLSLFLYIASLQKGLAIKFCEEGENHVTKCEVITLTNQHKKDLSINITRITQNQNFKIEKRTIYNEKISK